jgi:hypothetical protein
MANLANPFIGQSNTVTVSSVSGLLNNVGLNNNGSISSWGSYDDDTSLYIEDGLVKIGNSDMSVDLYELQMMYNFLVYKGYINKEEYETFKRQFQKLEEQG